MNKKEQIREEMRPGLIIEYLQNNQPTLAFVEEAQGSRIRALNINQREIKLALSRILSWTGPAYSPGMSREEITGLLKEHNRKRSTEQEKIKVLEVWEMAQGEIDQARVTWFAGLIWNEPDADQVAALGRTMLQARAYFKFNPPFFEVFPEDVVQNRIEQERLLREKERLISIGRDFFKGLWEYQVKGGSSPEIEDSEVSAKLERLIKIRVKYPDDSQTQDVWTKITTGLPQDQNLAFILGRIWGVFSPHYNFLLDQADYVWDDSWENEHQDQISKISKSFEDQVQGPELQGFVSIDSETTRDIDDAFIVEAGEGKFKLSLALACPAMLWEVGCPLDKAVAFRTTTLYLPEGTSNMLPRVMAEDIFSLVEGKPRPAMIVDVVFDENAQVLDLNISRKWVEIESNLTYEYVEDELSSTSPSYLADAFDLASALRRKRLEQGAVVIEQKDPDVSLDKSGQNIKVQISNKPPCPNAQLIVSEFMILANSLMASWAADRDITLYYRTQDIALPRDYCGVWSKPQEIYQIIRSLGATLTETSPKPHRALGVKCYTPITSPLRRYTDLINQLQIIEFLQNQKPAMTRAEMDEMLPGLNARISQVSQVQRFRPRYWKLVYFKQNCKKMTWQGIVVDNSGPVIVLSLPEELMMVRAGHEIFGGKTRLGQTFQLRLGKIDPLNNEISVLEAWEE
ncbi:MAG: ribonuclease catalytic domain-containing protein [Desulfonatronovibrio sp.]